MKKTFHPNDQFSLPDDNRTATETNKEVTMGHLPGNMLLDIARNESASREWRKAAVEILIDKKCPQANHPELYALVLDIKAERGAKQEVEAVVESALEEPHPETGHGALRASVTTATLHRSEDLPNFI